MAVGGRPSAALVASAVLVWLLLAAELVVLASHKAAIQASFCGWAAWLRTTFALGDMAHGVMRTVHAQTNSFNYMQVAAAAAALGQGDRAAMGTQLYVYTVIVHLAKNFGKSFIASPRGFWFCTEGHAISCGDGYSLPSGHSTMSLALILFLLHRLPQHRFWILPLSIIFECYTVFEIMYLGTHTPTDIVVGFTVALALFLAYRLWELPPIRPSWSALTASPEIQLGLGLACAAAIYRLEVLEDELDNAAVHAADLQANYTAYCSLEPGTAAAHMHNSTAYSKSALFFGVVVAWYLRRRFGLDTLDRTAPLLVRLLRTAGTLLVFSNSKAIVRALVVPALAPAWEPPVKFLPYTAQPILLLVLAPAAAHLLGLVFFAPKTAAARGRSGTPSHPKSD